MHRNPFICSTERLSDTALATSGTTNSSSRGTFRDSSSSRSPPAKTSGWCIRSTLAAVTEPNWTDQS